LGSSQAQTNITAARIKTKQRRPRRTKQKKQEELSGQEPEEKSREEEGNFRPVAFREYHLTAESHPAGKAEGRMQNAETRAEIVLAWQTAPPRMTSLPPG
jgi:hypothetical protein